MNFSGYSFFSPDDAWMAMSIVSTAVYFVLTSAFMRKYSQISINCVVAVTHGLAALMLFAFIDHGLLFSAMPPKLWQNLLLVALLIWIAKIFYFYAYSRTDVANVTVFSALTPLYAALISSMMGYPLTTNQIFGITIITFSVFAFFVKEIFRHTLTREKIKNTLLSNAGICAFLSTIPTAASAYFQKDAIGLSSPITVSFFICAFSSVASLAYILATKKEAFKIKEIQVRKTLVIIRPLCVIALLQAIAALSFSAFIFHSHPAVAQALQRLSSLLQILLAHIFLRQRLNTRWHMICVGFSIIGIYILNLK